jgi:hypothetical protein
MLGIRSRAGLEVADGNNLVPGPDSDGEGLGSVAQNGVGAIVERLQRWNDAAMTDADKGGRSNLAGSSLGSWALELCLGKEKAGAFEVFEKF